MRFYTAGCLLVAAAIAAEAALVAARGPGRYQLAFGWVAYAWLVASVVTLVVRLRRGQSPWLPATFVLYALADGFYGFYLVSHQPDPRHLALPGWLVAAHAGFAVAYGAGAVYELVRGPGG